MLMLTLITTLVTLTAAQNATHLTGFFLYTNPTCSPEPIYSAMRNSNDSISEYTCPVPSSHATCTAITGSTTSFAGINKCTKENGTYTDIAPRPTIGTPVMFARRYSNSGCSVPRDEAYTYQSGACIPQNISSVFNTASNTSDWVLGVPEVYYKVDCGSTIVETFYKDSQCTVLDSTRPQITFNGCTSIVLSSGAGLYLKGQCTTVQSSTTRVTWSFLVLVAMFL
jgi:hypothetical protein